MDIGDFAVLHDGNRNTGNARLSQYLAGDGVDAAGRLGLATVLADPRPTSTVRVTSRVIRVAMRIGLLLRLRDQYTRFMHFRPKPRPMVVDYRAIGAFSCKKPCFSPDILSSSPVFSYTSPEVLFIFNISKGQRPVSDPEKHIREPPQLAQAGIFHPLHEQRFFVLGSHQRREVLR